MCEIIVSFTLGWMLLAMFATGGNAVVTLFVGAAALLLYSLMFSLASVSSNSDRHTNDKAQ